MTLRKNIFLPKNIRNFFSFLKLKLMWSNTLLVGMTVIRLLGILSIKLHFIYYFKNLLLMDYI